MPTPNLKTGKPTRTAAELEAMIRRELREVYGGLSSSPVTVSPDGDSWKVVFSQDTSIDRFETTLLVSDRLGSQFDLKQ